MDTTLTDRQQLFVLEYLQDLNASAAAERAGYSARTRASQGGELMRNPAVRERIRLEMEADVRNALVISGKWRKGVPEVRFRQRNPEPALRALERVHERLEKLN